MANWTREQTLVALNMYCYTRYGRIHGRNPEIIRVAGLLGRTPNALALKMLNLASFDPRHLQRGVVSMGNASRLDEQVWQAFEADPDPIIRESEALMAQLLGAEPAAPAQDAVAEDSPAESAQAADALQQGWETGRLTTVRGNQGTFRRLILSTYQDTCCMTGIDIPQLLIASHIKPWAHHPGHRLDPRNGLCLNALHDRAFDRGLLTVDAGYTVRVSDRIRQAADRSERARFLAECDGSRIQLPDRFAPHPDFLDHHHRHIFVDSL